MSSSISARISFLSALSVAGFAGGFFFGTDLVLCRARRARMSASMGLLQFAAQGAGGILQFLQFAPGCALDRAQPVVAVALEAFHLVAQHRRGAPQIADFAGGIGIGFLHRVLLAVL